MSVRRDDADRSLAIGLSLIPTVLLVGAAAVFFVQHPDAREQAVVAWDLLWDGEPEPLRDWLLSFGVWAPVISALLQVATSIFPPGPSFILGIVNAMIFGLVPGALLTFGTAMGAAALCFGIARVVGRPGVVRLVSEERLEQVDGFMQRHGILAVFVARLIPFFNPDVVSYAAGVTGLRWFPFLLGVGAGSVPAVLFYSVIGATAVEASGWVIVMVMAASFLPLLLVAILGQRFWKRRMGLKDAEDS
ncbi:MAG: TVP38/TMEM64 family protein [Gemmatimonadales bacterium]|nr:MAG: TVP38/TMEM64 family protein [Gemmatimonadales bacterium]